MTDETQEVEQEQTEPEQEQEAPTQEEKTFSLEYVQELRQENAARRVALREMEQKQKEAEEAQLAEQQKWQELAEKRAAELQELAPYRDRYEAMLESVSQSNTKRIETIPEQMRGLVPDFEDPLKLSTWLDANSQLLQKPPAPMLNGRAGSGERPSEQVSLSPEELDVARKMNLTAKEYIDAKRG